MSIITRSVSIDTHAQSAMSISAPAGFQTAGHDDGLTHGHHWARQSDQARNVYPIVADASRIRTPSSAMHDDIHYAA